MPLLHGQKIWFFRNFLGGIDWGMETVMSLPVLEEVSTKKSQLKLQDRGKPE